MAGISLDAMFFVICLGAVVLVLSICVVAATADEAMRTIEAQQSRTSEPPAGSRVLMLPVAGASKLAAD